MIDENKKEYIYSQLIKVYSFDTVIEIIKQFESLYNSDSIHPMDIVEVAEELAELNHNTEKLPSWIYDIIPYDDFCNILEQAEITEGNEDFIKFDNNVYYQITNIVNSIC